MKKLRTVWIKFPQFQVMLWSPCACALVEYYIFVEKRMRKQKKMGVSRLGIGSSKNALVDRQCKKKIQVDIENLQQCSCCRGCGGG